MDYDTIWENFILICGYNYKDLPQTDEERYILIENGVSVYNQKTRKYYDRVKTGLVANRDTETINCNLSGDEFLLLLYCMCSVLATNKLSEFVSVWNTTANESGLKDYKAQVSARQNNVSLFEEKISTILEDNVDSISFQ